MSASFGGLPKVQCHATTPYKLCNGKAFRNVYSKVEITFSKFDHERRRPRKSDRQQPKKTTTMPKKIVPDSHIDTADVDSKFVAALFGLTRQRISQLASEGVIRNNGTRGRYVLTDVLAAYLDYLKKTKQGGAKEKLSRQQERKLKLENNRVGATLIPIDHAAESFKISCRLWRAGAEAIPKSIAARIAKTDNAKEISDILTEALNELVPAFRIPFDEFVRDTYK